MKQEVIDLEGTWYGGGFSFKLEKDKSGNIFDYAEIKKTSPISDEKILKFWNNLDKLGVWQWKKNIYIGNKNMNHCLINVLGS